MQDAEQLADNCAGGVGVRLQSREGDGRDDRKKYFSAQPDDE
jgi:hypothetical protein